MWICFPQDISEGKDQNAKKQTAAHLGECRGVLPRRDVLLHGGAAVAAVDAREHVPAGRAVLLDGQQPRAVRAYAAAGADGAGRVHRDVF